MAKRLQGDGSIKQAKDAQGKPIPNRWRICVSAGTDSKGKRVRIQRTVSGTKAEAKRKRDEIRQQYENGLSLDADRVTLSEFLDVWAETRKTSGRANEETVKTYRARLKAIEPYIGKKKLGKITAVEIERAYSQLKAKGTLSGTSLNKLHTLLKSVFKKAMDYDLILRNPCDKVDAPRIDKPKRKALTAEEGGKLLFALDQEEAEIYEEMDEKEARQLAAGNYFGRSSLKGLGNLSCTIGTRIALATGMRRGECFGLMWGNIDLKKATVHVTQNLTSYDEVKDPKTPTSIRTISIDAGTVAHLALWKQVQAQELLKLGIKQGDETPVCCSEKGGYMNLPNFERWWREFRTKAGFEGLRFHELRHTQASQLLANGVDLKTVQDRMGHANGAITLNWYAHSMPGNDAKAAQLVGEIFKPIPNKARVIELATA